MSGTVCTYSTRFLIYSGAESEELVVSIMVRENINVRSSNSPIVTCPTTIMVLIRGSTMLSKIILFTAHSMARIGTSSDLHHASLVLIMAHPSLGLKAFPTI